MIINFLRGLETSTSACSNGSATCIRLEAWQLVTPTTSAAYQRFFFFCLVRSANRIRRRSSATTKEEGGWRGALQDEMELQVPTPMRTLAGQTGKVRRVAGERSDHDSGEESTHATRSGKAASRRRRGPGDAGTPPRPFKLS